MKSVLGLALKSHSGAGDGVVKWLYAGKFQFGFYRPHCSSRL